MAKNVIFDYLTLCKPRVVLLMLVTAWVGMYLADPNHLHYKTYIYATIGIGLAACSAAIINHFMDRHIDVKMSRTATRPIATGRISSKGAIIFAGLLASIAAFLLLYFVNIMTAMLTFASLLGYTVVYTGYLKRATSQNIVIGGLSGAMPPLLGWCAISNGIDARALLLVLIIFIWTPPHFWALAIYRASDYRAANIPMLPVAYGVKFTKLFLFLYTLLLFAVTCLPFIVGMTGIIYFIGATCLNSIFMYMSICLYRSKQQHEHKLAIKTFNYSIIYLALLFSLLIIDNGAIH